MATAKASAPKMPQLASPQVSQSLNTLVRNYSQTTPARIKLIDSFLLFFMLSGILQFAYRILITSFPYNAFLGGSVGLSYSVAGLRFEKNDKD